jgi:hypothetical protein
MATFSPTPARSSDCCRAEQQIPCGRPVPFFLDAGAIRNGFRPGGRLREPSELFVLPPSDLIDSFGEMFGDVKFVEDDCRSALKKGSSSLSVLRRMGT